MLPKVQAALNFVKMGAEKRAVITSLDKLAAIDDAGTQITWK
jgi:carbamate kinase